MDQSDQGLVDPAHLHKIDKLFACGVGGEVDLPQLVVVGQQSSGKSSVLEGITGIPFPRDSTLCTRFATQIVFRRASQSSIRISVIAGEHASSEHRAKLEAWGRTLPSLENDRLGEIMTDVKILMGIAAANPSQAPKPAFSTDVLTIEISGPTKGHFSIIDVPGTFRRAEASVTTLEDIALVDNLVHGYMQNPRSIMLVVVPCNIDVANQEILQKAAELDPEGSRTLGILSKPDLVDRGAEGPIVDILQNRKHHLGLGWHVLRNPGQSQLKDWDGNRMDQESTFFLNSTPWCHLDDAIVGADSLRTRLQAVLADHLRREFPAVKAELVEKLEAAHTKLDRIGPRRQTREEQQLFLMGVAQRFREVADAASQGNYALGDLLDNEALRLATMTMNRSDKFAKDLEKYGQTYAFEQRPGKRKRMGDAVRPSKSSAGRTTKNAGNERDSGHSDSSDDSEIKEDVKADDTDGFEVIRVKLKSPVAKSASDRPIKNLPGSLTPTTNGVVGSAPGVVASTAASIVPDGPKPEKPPSTTSTTKTPADETVKAETIPSIKGKAPNGEPHRIYTRSIDTPIELIGTVGSQTTIPSVLVDGTDEWLTDMFHSSRGLEIGTFPAHLLGLTMRQQAKKWRDLAMGYVSDIISVVHTFTLTLLKALIPNDRVRNALMDILRSRLVRSYKLAMEHTTFLHECELNGPPATHNHYFNDEVQKCLQLRVRSLLESGRKPSTADNMSNAEYTIREMHDSLRAYYKIVRKRFVDNVRMQVVDNHLVTTARSPLKIFCPEFVIGLNTDDLASIAGDEASTTRQREVLEKQIQRLEEGMRILQ